MCGCVCGGGGGWGVVAQLLWAMKPNVISKIHFYHLVFKQGILTYLLLSKLIKVLFFNWEGLLKAGATHEIECDFRFKQGIKKFRFFLTQRDN